MPEPLRLGNIIHYVFDITEVLTGYTRVLIFDGDVLNATVGNLPKYTEHAITGAAVNSKGQSNFTSATIIRTNEDGKHIRLNTYRKSSSKPPPSNKPPFSNKPPCFRGRILISPPPPLHLPLIILHW